MSINREYQKNKLKNATREIDNKQFSRKLVFHKWRKFILIFSFIAIAVIAILGYNVYERNLVYTDYEVLSISQLAQNADSRYMEFNGKLLRYGMDGIVCLEKDNSKVWEISYRIKYPVVALCKDYGAVASRGGRDLYVFNEEGLQQNITVNYPIRDISVAAQGAVAVTMESDGVSYIDIYDADGERKVSSKTMLEGNGYPLDTVISPDGQKLMVSYLDIADELLESSIAFYNFSEVGQDYIWNMVGAFDDYYDDTIIPYVAFVNDTTACAVGDNRLTIYGIKEIPEIICDIAFEKELATFFYSTDYIGLVYNNSSDGGLYQMDIYDLAGNKLLGNYKLDGGYQKIQFVNDHILIYDSNSCKLLTLKGTVRFDNTFDKNFKLLEPISLTHYIMVTNTTISEIRIK